MNDKIKDSFKEFYIKNKDILKKYNYKMIILNTKDKSFSDTLQKIDTTGTNINTNNIEFSIYGFYSNTLIKE